MCRRFVGFDCDRDHHQGNGVLRDGSGTTSFDATIDPATRFVTPIAIGFTKATGMIFVPNS